ncbi:MAG: hypothetical protein GY863_09090, partial [bacterium]|nr:hypothetical protein [bacterium]
SEISGRIVFKEVGRTTDDNPYAMVYVSSEDNIRKLDHYKAINDQLADPRNLTQEQADALIGEGKTIIGINCSIHSTEVGPAQAAVNLIYKLASDNSQSIKEILDNVILVLTPIHNPDGYKMVVDWWRQYKGTEYEGSRMPYLYHRYVGHDNNRDWYMFTQAETQLTIKHLYEEWHPQIVIDMHQMGSSGARLFVPPFVDPFEPNIDPILISNINMMGTYMMNRLTSNGLTGIESYKRFDGWTPGRAFHHYHGAIRILTETASVNIAGPIEITKEQLNARGYLKNRVFMPRPWQGGTWALSDLVKYNYQAQLATLENAAKLREVWLRNFYNVGMNCIAEKEDVFAVIIPADQRDPYTAKWLIDVLQTGLVEIHKATADFTAGGKDFKKGSAIIYMNQPYYGFAKTLLEPQVYPEFREYPGGPLKRPYDFVSHTLPYLMGVDVTWISERFDADIVMMESAEVPEPAVTDGAGENGYILPIESNGTYIALNRLLADGFTAYWSSEEFIDGDREYPEGTVIVYPKDNDNETIKTAARGLNLDLIEKESSSRLNGYKLSQVNLGVFKSWSGNSSEGWTRWILEKFEFNYESAHNDDIIAGNLNDKFNTILLADFRGQDIVEGRTRRTPPDYQGGVGREGVENMKQFVNNGGTLISYGNSNDFVIDQFGLRVRNVVQDFPRDKFFIPGSILRTTNDVNHPVAYGIPAESKVFYNHRNQSVFRVSQGKIISRYPDSADLLLSGWLEGGNYLRGRANVVEVPYGNGRIVLIGFDPVYRAQAQASFKYLFNAMFYGAAERASIVPPDN